MKTIITEMHITWILGKLEWSLAGSRWNGLIPRMPECCVKKWESAIGLLGSSPEMERWFRFKPSTCFAQINSFWLLIV